MSELPVVAGAVDLFGGIAVSDYPTALAWYERLWGGPPTFCPNDHEAVWELAEHRFLYIEHRPERAGRAQHTLFVEHYDSVLADLSRRGVEPVTTETYENGVRKAIYVDPDGNEIGLGGAPASSSSS